jgi:hypothetical protein
MADEKKISDVLNAADEKAHKAALTAAAAPAAVPDDPAKYGVEHCCVRQFWAVVETNGTLVRGRGVSYCRKLGTGIYEVFFTADMTSAVFGATLGRPGIFTEPPGEITVAVRYTGPSLYSPFTTNKGVWVQTFNSAGAPVDHAFHLTAFTQH